MSRTEWNHLRNSDIRQIASSRLGWTGYFLRTFTCLLVFIWVLAPSETYAQNNTPTVSNVNIWSSPESGDTYGWYENINLSVRFDQDVEFTNRRSIQLALTIGTQTETLNATGHNNNSLHFRHRVGSSDSDANGISVPANSIALNGGTIKAASDGTTDAELDHDAMADSSSHKVNGSLVRSPKVSSIYILSSPSADGTYMENETIQVRVRFNKPVSVTGSPQLGLTIGNHTRQATFTSFQNSVPTSPVFEYTVHSSDSDADGISIAANAITLNGGKITARVDATVNANRGHDAVAANSDHKVDGGSPHVVPAPTVSSISLTSSPGSGDTYGFGETIMAQVIFDQGVTLTDASKIRLTLTVGTQSKQISVGGFSSNSITFGYEIQSTDSDENGVSIPANAITLNGAEIKAESDSTTDADLDHDDVTPENSTI